MRIAEIAPPYLPVPPAGYGGIELVVSALADGLADRGHDVTLFASGGSSTRGELVSPLVDAPGAENLGEGAYGLGHAAAAHMHAGDFDVVHDHTLEGPALAATHRHPAVVHTLHGPWTSPIRDYYRLVHAGLHLVAISERQRADNPDVDYAGTVPNGIDLEAHPFREEKEDFLVYVGRAIPDKGPADAIEVARRAELPLAMVVKRDEPQERKYWDTEVAPRLNGDVEVYDRVSHDEKVDLLGRARAMVFPIQWPEPFGLVMTEAMACGTPVVSRPLGAAQEVVRDGVTGFLRDSIDDLAVAVAQVDTLEPADCREWVQDRFSTEAMVDGYEEVFSRVSRSVRAARARVLRS